MADGGNILTHVTGIRRLVVDATKRKDPNQSNSRSFNHIEPSLICNRRQIGIPIAAIVQKGRFNQNIHLQLAFSAKAPPMTIKTRSQSYQFQSGSKEYEPGPRTDPTAHCAEMMDIHFPLSRRVTMSVIITYVKDTRPPPPTPCKHLPTSKSEMLLATEHTIVPMVNNNNAVRMTDLRPMI